MQPSLAPALVVVSVLLFVAILVILALWRRCEALLQGHGEAVEKARKQSVNQSRSTLKGQISEQLAPFLPGFLYLPADCRFIGNPIDYLIFRGYSCLKDPDAIPEDLEIVLLDVKSGNSPLSREQRAIGRAVAEGRFRFEVSRIADDGTVDTKEWRPGTRRESSKLPATDPELGL